MYYTSTRDKRVEVSGATAILQGISKDGGLFIPREIPKVSLDFLQDGDYRSIAEQLLSLYLTDFSKAQIHRCVEAAYGENFKVPDMTGTVKAEQGIYVTELFHGPTCAFKDMALQIMPHLLTTALEITGERKQIVILTATSGDTGKAALDGFADVPGVKIMVFYPVDGVSRIQKLQMSTQQGDNVRVCAIRGNFDHAQSGVKEIFANKELEAKLAAKNVMLSSANSINIARLIPQIVYYFHAYHTLLKQGELRMGEPVCFAVPTGNFGNILAGYFAKEMGLPIERLICASNQNNVLTDFIQTGVYEANRSFYTTTSPSMDILVSSNLERLLFLLSGQDDCLVASLMKQLKEQGRYTVSEALLRSLGQILEADSCNDKETADCIRTVYERDRYLADPHTAVALHVCLKRAKREGDVRKTVVLSTASPFKFCESVLTACGISFDERDPFDSLRVLSEQTGLPIPQSLARLEFAEVRFTNVMDREAMAEAVLAFCQ